MKLEAIQKTTDRSKKRVGRGYGSGKGGHTSGRGAKGQKARSKVSIDFEGAARGASFFKRLPLLRGKGKLKANTAKPVGVNIKYLNLFKKNETVSVASLIEKKIVDGSAEKTGAKLLGDGELSVAVKVTIPATKSAQKKIEAAGGSVEIASSQPQTKQKSKKK